MNSVASGVGREKRRLSIAVRESLRELGVQLNLLNRQVSARAGLKDVDLECLDLIGRHSPISPSALAKLAGLHPATLTGILDRLEKGGWVERSRDPADRRAVLLRSVRERNAEIFQLYAGMTGAVDELCGGYSEEELKVIADFLTRTTTAGRTATAALTTD